MHEAEELDRLRAQVLGSAHDLANAVGVAINYVTFLGEDIGGGDPAHPIWPKLAPIEAALRRAADSVRELRDRAHESAARGGAGAGP